MEKKKMIVEDIYRVTENTQHISILCSLSGLRYYVGAVWDIPAEYMNLTVMKMCVVKDTIYLHVD